MTTTLTAGSGGLYRGDRTAFKVALFVIGLLAVATLPALKATSVMWSQAEYGHAWLIMPLAVLLFVHRFAAARHGGNRLAGVAFCSLSVALMVAGWATRNTTLSVYGGIAGVYGLTWACVGHRGMRDLTAPIAFLAFMIPLPLALYIALSQAMQLISSKMGVALIAAMGVDVFGDGNVIELANGRLEVAEACNGLRYLFPLLSIACLLAMLLEDRLWKKIALVLSALPIALAMNAVRLALIGVLVDRYGMSMAEGTQHEVEGFAVFALCVGLLLLEMNVLARVGTKGSSVAVDALLPDRRTLRAVTRWPPSLAFGASSLILAAGALLVSTLPARVEIVPDRRSLALFPMSLGDWAGSPQSLDPQVLASLGLTDYMMAEYRPEAGGANPPLNLYIAYYQSQRLGIQVHSPRLCIPGGGWDVVSQSTIEVARPDGTTSPADRVVIQKGDVRQIVYYWFEERGRRLTSEAEIKLFALVDAVKRNRSDGALVRLVAPVTGKDDAQADRALRDFVALADPVLHKFLPE